MNIIYAIVYREKDLLVEIWCMYTDELNYTNDKGVTYGIEYKPHFDEQINWSTNQAFYNADNWNNACGDNILLRY